MNLKILYYKISKRFWELWEYKIFRFAVIIHFFYLILSIFLTLIFFRYQNDFLVYYKVGEVFITDINNLYTADYLWPFRYFPISATLFVPFYFLGFDTGFIIFNFINLLLNIVICVLIYKIIIHIRREYYAGEDKRIILYISLFLLSLPNLFNYILGQINLYVTFLILLSLLLFLKHEKVRWDFIASIILGISVIIKPITIFMIPFLIIIQFNYQEKKFEFEFLRTLIRLIGVILPLTLNFTFFIVFPTLWEGFISTNFTGEEPIILNHSFSLTKIITNFCIFYKISYNPLLILIIILFIIGGPSFFIFIFRKSKNNSIIFAYLFGILIMLLVYYDSWPHHLLVLTPILIILIFSIPRDSNITENYLKPSLFFFNFFDLGFMGIWFLTQKWFPLNFMSTLFLLITFYSVSRICLMKVLDNQKN